MVITSGEMAEKAKEQLTQTLGQCQLLGKEICDTVVGNQGEGQRVKSEFLPWVLAAGVSHVTF